MASAQEQSLPPVIITGFTAPVSNIVLEPRVPPVPCQDPNGDIEKDVELVQSHETCALLHVVPGTCLTVEPVPVQLPSVPTPMG
jgi:hypothetical protein